MQPGIALFLRRLISFDRRGTGASDPLPGDMPPPWEAASARYVAGDDYPIGLPPERAEALIARVEETGGPATASPTASPAAPVTVASTERAVELGDRR